MVIQCPPFLSHATRLSAMALFLTTASLAHAQTDQDTVRWDARAGQWVYTLHNPADPTRYKDIRYTPRTLINPLVRSVVRWDKGLFEYGYQIANATGAKQTISEISVRAPKWDAQAIQHAPLQPGLTGPQLVAIGRAEMAVEKAFVANTLYSPHRWEPYLNVNRPDRVVFGWLAKLDKDFSGIAPNAQLSGFSVLRPELPGAAWMFLQGDTPDTYYAASLPRTGAQADHADQVLNEDSVDVAVLAPAIVLPKPYNGAELARRIKAHAATWADVGLMDAEHWPVLALKLDGLIEALTANDKRAAKEAAIACMAEVFRHHPGMTGAHAADDHATHYAKPAKRTFLSEQGTLQTVSDVAPPVNRVAARALVFDLVYLLTRMEMGR